MVTHMNNILKVEVFNCFVVSASFCTCNTIEACVNCGLSEFNTESWIKSVSLRVYMYVSVVAYMKLSSCLFWQL